MWMTKSNLTIGIALIVLAGCLAVAGTITESEAFVWSENIGWINWKSDEETHVAICPNVLSGFIWSENCGWINLGNGVPEDGIQYSNTSASDFGVNHDGGGNLSGLAWGENIGWINFDGSSTGGNDARVTVDLLSGRLNGFAWGENIGWINFADSAVVTDPDFLQAVSLDRNKDGVVNAEDLIQHLESGNPCRICREWALDFSVKWQSPSP